MPLRVLFHETYLSHFQLFQGYILHPDITAWECHACSINNARDCMRIMSAFLSELDARLVPAENMFFKWRPFWWVSQREMTYSAVA
ncbi:hypothetical protein LCGC14_0024040 [marine sediment metagenome]|uniref:Uncharacterized protein n=1 Tax=marine sediment metagenome TaxID=412755 RepID=A0A0F9W0V9_9ZZZZ